MNDAADVEVPLISVVCPVFNEDQVIDTFIDRVSSILEAAGLDYEIVCVNDGSTDQTLELLLDRRAADSRIKVVDLSRNFGKEAALTAALEHARGRTVVPIDADLQDPAELIPALLEKWREGHEIVLAKRRDRAQDSWWKRSLASAFYRINNVLSETPLPDNVGDFRLLDRIVVDAILRLPERRRFMKGIFAWIGFRTCVLEYDRPARAAGSSKFSGWRLWNLAIEGITSFSTAPLRLWTYVGCLIAALAFAYGSYIIAITLLFGASVPGYASLLSVVLFMGGVQLIGIGILGEYIGRTYIETKQRPLYVVRNVHR